MIPAREYQAPASAVSSAGRGIVRAYSNLKRLGRDGTKSGAFWLTRSAGAFLVVTGLVGLVLPLPGLPLLFAGMILLGFDGPLLRRAIASTVHISRSGWNPRQWPSGA